MGTFADGMARAIEITKGAMGLCQRSGHAVLARELQGLIKLFQAAADQEDTAKQPAPICQQCGGPVSLRCGGCGWWPGAGIIRTDPP